MDASMLDVRRITYAGKLHGTGTIIVHASKLIAELRRLDAEDVRVIKIEEPGWTTVPEFFWRA